MRCLIQMVCIIIAQSLIFMLTLPVSPPPFCLLNTHLPHRLLPRLQYLHYWASHIPDHHHAEDCLLSHGYRREDSDSPFRISLADLLNASALWATSLTCLRSSHDLYHFNVSPSHSPVGFCLGSSPRTLYTPLSSLRYSIPCYGNVIMPKSECICYLMISYYPSIPYLCQCVCQLISIV